MKKPTFIIERRHIILSCLTAMLAVAVYINYSLAGSPVTTPVSELRQDSVNYGDTEFVSAAPGEPPAGAEEVSASPEPDPAADYFAQARLEKSVSRDEAIATMQMMLGGGDLTQDEAIATAIDAVGISALVEKEGNIESLIKSQGFSDCVVYLDGDSAKVVVRSDGLNASDAALIKDIILGEVTISSENIRIFEVK